MTKKERLNEYINVLLVYKSWIGTNTSSGLCLRLRSIRAFNWEHNAKQYPEIFTFRNWFRGLFKSYWFPLNEYGNNKRIELLEKAIKQLEKTISNT